MTPKSHLLITFVINRRFSLVYISCADDKQVFEELGLGWKGKIESDKVYYTNHFSCVKVESDFWSGRTYTKRYMISPSRCLMVL
jgi:hypothetical protein